MSIKLLALDLDGTTLHNDHHTVSPQNISAIHSIIQNNIYFVPSTGRAIGRLPEFLQEFPLRYIITANGAKLTDLSTNQILYQNTLSIENIEYLFHKLEKFPLYIELYADGFCYTDTACEPFFNALPLSEERKKMMSLSRIAIPNLLQFLRDGNKDIEKLNLPFLPPELHNTIMQILSSIPGLEITSSLPQNAEINAAGCNKGVALAFLCKYLGILPEQVMAIGDNGNDVEMLRFAGIALTPANAAPCAKKIAITLSSTNEQSAVAEAIKRYIHI